MNNRELLIRNAILYLDEVVLDTVFCASKDGRGISKSEIGRDGRFAQALPDMGQSDRSTLVHVILARLVTNGLVQQVPHRQGEHYRFKLTESELNRRS